MVFLCALIAKLARFHPPSHTFYPPNHPLSNWSNTEVLTGCKIVERRDEYTFVTGEAVAADTGPGIKFLVARQRKENESLCGNVRNNDLLHILETHLVAFVPECYSERDPEKHRAVSQEQEFKLKNLLEHVHTRLN